MIRTGKFPKLRTANLSAVLDLRKSLCSMTTKWFRTSSSENSCALIYVSWKSRIEPRGSLAALTLVRSKALLALQTRQTPLKRENLANLRPTTWLMCSYWRERLWCFWTSPKISSWWWRRACKCRIRITNINIHETALSWGSFYEGACW